MLQPEQLSDILTKANTAPSGNNLQAWKFFVENNIIHLYLDPSLQVPFWDTAFAAPYFSAGAVIENIRIAALFHGFKSAIEYFPDEKNMMYVARMTLVTGADSQSPDQLLYPFIEKRCTNRKFYDPLRPVPETVFRDLETAFSQNSSVHILWRKITDSSYTLLSDLISQVDRLRLEHETTYRELLKGLRFNKKDLDTTKTGIGLASVEGGWVGECILRFISSWQRLKICNLFGLSRFFAHHGRKQILSTPAIGLVYSKGQTPKDYVESGIVGQRLWLKATAHGLSLQPIAGIPIMILNLSRSPDLFSPLQQREIADIKKKFFAIFPIPETSGLMFLFRIGYSPAPSAKTLRRPIESFLLNKKP